MARGLLRPRLTLLSSTVLMAMLVCPMLDMLPMEPTPTPMVPTPMPTPMFPLAPALDWTPSPRVLMLPPRDMPPMPPMDIWDMPMESKSSLRRDQ